jgi:hypothetical protein
MSILIINPVMLLLAATVTTGFAQPRYTESMYRQAIVEQSTAPLYVLFTLHDPKMGQDKVVCTTANFLLGAIHIEYGLDYDEAGEKRGLAIVLQQPGHRFTFTKRKALRNLESGDTPQILAEARHYLKSMSDAQIRQNIANQKLDRWCERVQTRQWDSCQAAIAHVLLERGLLVGHGDYVPELYLER